MHHVARGHAEEVELAALVRLCELSGCFVSKRTLRVIHRHATPSCDHCKSNCIG